MWALKKEASGQSNVYVLAGVIVLVGLIVGGLILALGGDSEPSLEAEEITTILDEGTCTEADAAILESQAAELTEASEAALKYEELVECYIQIGDDVKGAAAAEKAIEAFSDAGNAARAEQMQRALELFNETIEFESQPQEDFEEPEVINVDTV